MAFGSLCNVTSTSYIVSTLSVTSITFGLLELSAFQASTLRICGWGINNEVYHATEALRMGPTFDVRFWSAIGFLRVPGLETHPWYDLFTFSLFPIQIQKSWFYPPHVILTVHIVVSADAYMRLLQQASVRSCENMRASVWAEENIGEQHRCIQQSFYWILKFLWFTYRVLVTI